METDAQAGIERDVRRSLEGDARAFDRIVRDYAGPLRGFLRRLVGDFHVAQDLSQETFLKAYQSLDKLGSPASFGPWLFRIAFHVAIDHRRRAEEGLVSLESLEGQVVGQSHSPPEGLEAEEERRRRYRSVVDAVSHLPEPYALVLVLRYLEQRSYGEMSELLDLTVTNVKVRLHRARKMVRRRVAAEELEATNGFAWHGPKDERSDP